MTSSQSQFRAALLQPDLPEPEGLQDPKGRPAGARFSVYRNNVVVSLSEALEAAFPLVRKLLGGERFGQLAVLYVRACPPTSPLMMFYGKEFPDFLATFSPLKHIGYLADCARLDYAFRLSYHAADAEAFDPELLTQDGFDQSKLRLRLSPASQVIRSRWPLYDIWQFNAVNDAPKPRAVAQDVLVTRPGMDPVPFLLPPGTADWLDRLNTGTPFEAACDAQRAETPEFDLQESLAVALRSKAFTHFIAKDN